ncbi:MAG: RNA polymerase sigma factor [Deltaproteobacteria bacterium]|nr:RNA polymerase sigma factor [Deltaproteobacteria bacterium]
MLHTTTPPRGPSELRATLAALRPELYGRALRLARCRAAAEDIVQETMLRALRFEAQYREGTNLRAWVGKILHSVFLTCCRRARRERRALQGLGSDPCGWTSRDAPPMACSLSPRPARALADLPEGYRRAVELVDLQDLSYGQAATRLRVPLGTIMSRLHRGRRLLAQALGPDAARLASEPAVLAA